MEAVNKVVKSEKDFTGIVMIVSSLVVIALIVGILLSQRASESQANKRNVGVSLVKILSNMPASELEDSGRFFPLMQNLLLAQSSSGLQYIVLTDKSGRIVHDTTVPGVTTPPANLSGDPSTWVNVEKANVLSDGRPVMEFYAPVFRGSELSGFVRIGFAGGAQRFGLGAEQVSFLGGIALPIFLLTPIFIILMRREMKRLSALLPKIASDSDQGAQSMALIPDSRLSKVAMSLDSFISQTEQRIAELDEARLQALAAEKVNNFKLQNLESILNSLPEAILLIGESGRVVFANNRVPAFLDVKAETIHNASLESWSQEPELQNFLMQFKDGAGRVRHSSVDYQPTTRPDVHYQITSMPLYAADDPKSVLGALIVVRDITLEAIEKNSGAEFVAHVTHELKSPLNVLAMYSETLMDDGGRDEVIRTEAINVIRDQVERMTMLINNLLSVSQIESGVLKPRRARTKLSDLLKDLYDGAREISQAKELNLSMKVPQELSKINIDKDLIYIALKNLLTNAIKYNRANGSVTLAAEETDESILIKVTDTGLGISQADLSKIFEKFYRSSDPEAAARGGHGLGLYLAKQIVALHYGRLSVASELGVGSEFTISFDKTKTLMANAL